MEKFKIKTSTLFLGVLLILFIFLKVTWQDSFASLYEGVAIAFILLTMICLKPLREYFQSLPCLLKKIYTTLALLMLLTHLMNIPRVTFPFIPWPMFSVNVKETEVMFFKYIGHTKNGTEVSLKPAAYFRSLVSARIVTDLDNLIKSLVMHDGPKEQFLKEKYLEYKKDAAENKGLIKNFFSELRLQTFSHTPTNERRLVDQTARERHLHDTLIAIGRRYNKLNPNNPLLTIEIQKGTLDIAQRPNSKIHWLSVWTTNISGEENQ